VDRVAIVVDKEERGTMIHPFIASVLDAPAGRVVVGPAGLAGKMFTSRGRG
jgi:hypothetical protein